MNYNSARSWLVTTALFLLVSCLLQQALAGEIPSYDKTVFASFPETLAVEKLLLQEKKFELLQNGVRVDVHTNGDFGTAVLWYRWQDKDAKLKVFLFKKMGEWAAYLRLPTHEDSFGLFYLLAEQYFREKYPHYEGMGYRDDGVKNRDPRKRIIDFTWSEQVDGNWVDHPASLIYTYDRRQGWHITGDAHLSETTGKKISKKTEQNTSNDTAPQGYSLHVAVSMASLSPANEIATIKLVENSPDVNSKDDLGRTPLHILCYGCLSPRVVQALIGAGADVNVKSNDGYTPLDLVNMMQASGQVTTCPEIRKMLVQAGAR